MISKEAIEAAFGLLARRPYSRSKLKKKLSNKGYGQEADEVIEWLLERQLLDEDTYITARVKGWLRKGLSIRAIAHRLRNEEIKWTEDQIREVFDEVGQSELANLERLAEKKIRILNGASATREKTYRFLLSKGYSSASILRVLDRLMSGAGES